MTCFYQHLNSLFHLPLSFPSLHPYSSLPLSPWPPSAPSPSLLPLWMWRKYLENSCWPNQRCLAAASLSLPRSGSTQIRLAERRGAAHTARGSRWKASALLRMKFPFFLPLSRSYFSPFFRLRPSLPSSPSFSLSLSRLCSRQVKSSYLICSF